jgi:hypothetical protein
MDSPFAFYIGDCSRKSVRKLWKNIPAIYRDQATFYAAGNPAYQVVIPQPQHHVIKKLNNHIGAFRNFLWDYNLEVTAAIPVQNRASFGFPGAKGL